MACGGATFFQSTRGWISTAQGIHMHNICVYRKELFTFTMQLKDCSYLHSNSTNLHKFFYQQVLASALLRLAHCCCVSGLHPVSVQSPEPESPLKGSHGAVYMSLWAPQDRVRQSMSNQVKLGGARVYSNSEYYLRSHHSK